MFYHPGQNNFGCYDSNMQKSIWKTVLGDSDVDFAKNITPQNESINVGSSSKKFNEIYVKSGMLQTYGKEEKDNIEYINDDPNENNIINKDDVIKFFKNINFITYNWKDKNCELNQIKTQLGFLTQKSCGEEVGSLIITDKEYSMTSFVMALGIALQKEIEKVELLEEELKKLCKKL